MMKDKENKRGNLKKEGKHAKKKMMKCNIRNNKKEEECKNSSRLNLQETVSPWFVKVIGVR